MVGYKQTDVGLIPDNWNYDSLVNLTAKIGSGITPRGGSRIYKKYGRPFLRSQNIGWGELLLSDIVYISDEVHSTFSNTEIKKGDVFLNISGASIGRSSYATGILVGGNVNQHVCIIRTKNNLDPKYLNKVLLSPIGQSQIDSFQSGGNREGLNIGQIKTFLVPIPPLKEQEAIAEVLSDTDKLITALEKRIAKKRLIKQGAMQTLLTPKDDWEVKKIKDIVSTPVTDGPHLTPKFQTTGIPFLSVNNLVDNKVDLSDLRYISKEDDKIFSMKCKPQKGDLLFGKAASVGKIAIVEEDIDFNIWSPIALIRLNKENDPKFVYYFFQTNKVLVQISYFTNASSQGNVGMGDIEKIELALPTITEQTRIATILSDMDNEIDALEKKLSKTKELKQGLMQQLLTGKIRLV